MGVPPVLCAFHELLANEPHCVRATSGGGAEAEGLKVGRLDARNIEPETPP